VAVTKEPIKRLPRNFHKTFVPERQYISALLKYVAEGKWGSDQEISAATGIPTGVSSGKVPAIRDYCRGMALIRPPKTNKSKVKTMELTPFGRAILLEDPYLKERVTQWIAHFNICRHNGGADVWYNIFCKGFAILGMNFSKAELEKYLAAAYGTGLSDVIGPLYGMYSEEASFATCAALDIGSNGALLIRKPAPILEEIAPAYGAWILQMIRDNFPRSGQVTVAQLNEVAGLQSIPGWGVTDLQRALELIERKGALHVDRHMNPWIIHPAADVDEQWGHIYSDLI